MKYFLVILSLLSILLYSNSYALNISLKDDSIPVIKLYLSFYTDGYLQLKDSVVVTQANHKSITFETGNYIGYAELNNSLSNKPVSFVINPNEKNMQLNFSMDDLKNGDVTFLNTKDNLIHSNLVEMKNKLDKIISEIRYKEQTLNRFDSFYLNRLLKYEMLLQKNFDEMNFITDSLFKIDTSQYSYIIADFLKSPTINTNTDYKKYFDNYSSLLHYHFFDFINFSNPLILNHPAYASCINQYFNTYCDNFRNSITQGIDILMTHASKNEKVKSFTFNYLLELLLKRNNDVEVTYLNEKYANGCGLQLSAQKMKEFSGIVQTQIGATIPDIIAYDSKNELRSLLAEVAKNKLTVVYVWLSSCHACQKRTPELLSLLAPFQKKGLGVFTISLDENKDSWLSAILKYNMNNLINISELTSLQKSTILPKLNIRTTPKLFLLDKAGKILLKDGYNTELINKINSIIK